MVGVQLGFLEGDNNISEVSGADQSLENGSVMLGSWRVVGVRVGAVIGDQSGMGILST